MLILWSREGLVAACRAVTPGSTVPVGVWFLPSGRTDIGLVVRGRPVRG